MKFSGYILVIFIILGLTSCNRSSSQSGILTNQKTCSLTDCPNPPDAITGSFSIQADSDLYQMNVDQSDIIEITGKCFDLNRRNNRILVQVFEGENLEKPYIQNDISVNCSGNSTVPSIDNSRCIWVTRGKPRLDGSTEFPQCFNGRFSFSVKLGRILREKEDKNSPDAVSDDAQNPRRKYVVKYKLRAVDGDITGPIVDTPWNQALIERGISKPTFSLESLIASYQCKLHIDAFKNTSYSDTSSGTTKSGIYTEVSYTPRINRDFLSILGTTTVTEFDPLNPLVIKPIPPGDWKFTYPITSGTSVIDFALENTYATLSPIPVLNLIPGVKYNIQVQAEDHKYSYVDYRNASDVTEKSGFSEPLSCNNQQALLSGTLSQSPIKLTACPSTLALNTTSAVSTPSTNSGAFCQFTLGMPAGFQSYGASGQGYIEWYVQKNVTDWDPKFVPPATTRYISIKSVGTCLNGDDRCTAPYDYNEGQTLPQGESTFTGVIYRRANLPNTPFIFRPENYTPNSCSGTTTINHSYNGTYGVAARYVSPTGLKSDWSQVVPCTITLPSG